VYSITICETSTCVCDEQHVDHRRDVHVGRSFELLGLDDAVGAVVQVSVSH
jgi:hypothetical protein